MHRWLLRRVHRAGVALCSVLGLAFFTAALAGSISHVGLVQHEICAEHGALVEHYGHSQGADLPLEGHDHEAHEPQKHCSMLLCAACLAANAPTDLLGPVTLVVHDVSAPFSQLPVEHSSRERLDLAPKTSPPSV